MSHKNGNKKYWTDEKLTEDAKRFMYRNDWSRFSGVAYGLSIKDKAKHAERCAHMAWSGYYNNPPPKPKGYWTKARVLEEAAKYSSFSEWKKASSSSYLKAYARGWKSEVEARLYHTKRMLRGPEYWTKKRILAHVSRYKKIMSASDFKKHDPIVYRLSRELRIYSRCVAIICGYSYT